MHKQTEIAVSALISIMVAMPPAVAAPHKRSVAMVPGTIPHMMPARNVATAMSPAQRQLTIQKMVRSSYPSGHFQRGMAMRQRGDYNGALIEFLKAAQENPLQVRAFYEQAVIFKQKGYLKLAQSALQQALVVKPDYRDARVLLASTYLDSGDLSHAASELVASLGLNNGRTRAVPPADAASSMPPSDLLSRPPRSASVIQTPHGMLSLIAPQKAAEKTSPDAFVQPLAEPSANNSNNVIPDLKPKGKPDRNAFEGEQQSDFSITDLLKGIGIPGLESSNSQPEVPAPAATSAPLTSAAAPAEPLNTVKAAAGSTQDPIKETLLAANSSNPAQQIQDMLQEAGRTASRGMHMPNLFRLFGATGEKDSPKKTEEPQSTPASVASDTAIPQVEETKSKKHRKRARKRRVAAWVDHMLDGSHNTELPDSRPQQRTVQITHDDGTVEHKSELNPIELMVRQANEAQKNSLAQSANQSINQSTNRSITEAGAQSLNERAVQPVNQSASKSAADGADSSDPLAVRTVEFSHKVELTTAASSANKSWVPAPTDISNLIKKAVSWVPLPIFKPAPNPNDQFAAPLPVSSGASKAELPSPVLAAIRQANGISRGQTLPELQSTKRPQPNNAQPSPIAMTAPVPATFNNPAKSAARFGSDALDSVMNMLPKDVVATIEQVLNPSPVDIARPHAATPPLQQVTINKSNVQSIAPLTASNQKRYEQLVTARIGSPAQEAGVAMPVPIKQTTSRNSNAPAPLPLAVQSTSQGQYATPTPYSASAPTPLSPLPVPNNIQGSSMRPPQGGLLAYKAPGASSSPFSVPAPALPNARYSPPLPGSSGPVSFVSGAAPMAQQPPIAGEPAHRHGAPAPMQLQPTANGQAPNVVALRVPARGAGVAAPAPLAAENTNVYAPLVAAVAGNAHEPQKTVAVAAMPPSNIPGVPLPTVNKVAQPVTQRLANQGFKFVAPALTAKQLAMMNTLKSVKIPVKAGQALQAKMAPVKPPMPEDEWTKRMKYLLENGTQSLGRGEAFMFSEETGEGVLFLGNGNTIRRKIAEPQDHEQVAMLRRPDILKPQGELQYNLSLLGKIIKPTSKPDLPTNTQTAPSGLSVNEVLGKPDGFFGWLKNVFKL